MFCKIIVFALVIQLSKCSVVVDIINQRGIHVSDYCPKMKFCPEGAHVMCMYYDPKHVMGPRCSNPKNVSITNELANKLLEVSNAVRSKIALGKEKGKGGNYLPRGYGIFKLKWDSELATFAQVLANQCVLRHDLCRATQKFPDPGQTAGLVRFSYPDWYPVSKMSHFTTPGLNTPKLNYAITQTLKSWYGQKNSVTEEMINNYPDWNQHPNQQEGRLYLEMIYGPATHMGCGISAYTEYAYYDNNAALNYNSVQVICNYSSRPQKFGSVYNTIPPTSPGFSMKCGCPVGSDEDTDCLCEESTRIPPAPVKHATRKCARGDMNCDPAVVVLPIFTMEDAPPHKLISPYGSANESIIDKNSLEIFDYYEKSDAKHDLLNEHINEHHLNDPHMDLINLAHTSRPITAKKQILDVRNRYFNRKAFSNPTHYVIKSRNSVLRQAPVHKKNSVFSGVPTFELPFMKRTEKSDERKFNVFKKDVMPRNNFHSVQNEVKSYITRKITNDPFVKIGIPEPIKSLSDDYIHGNDGVTETILHTAEDKVIDYNKYLNDNHIQTITEGINETTDKLMMLLDNLEKLVRNIELRDMDKEIFDAKMRKIYGEVIGKPNKLLSTGIKTETALYKTLSDGETHKTNYHVIRTDVGEKHSNSEIDKRLLLKNPNSEFHDEDKHTELPDTVKDYSRNKFTISAESPQYPTYAEDIKTRNVYKSDLEKSGYTKENGESFSLRSKKERMPKKYVDFEAYDDPLSPDRRKFYQEKLDRLERKLRNNRKHHNDLERQRGVRPMRPTEDLHSPTRSKNNMEDTFYPERARFINRFR